MSFPAYDLYKDSDVPWLGDVPHGWELTRLKNVFQLQKRTPLEGDGIVTAFRDGEVTLRSNRRTEGYTNAIREHGYQRILEGDLVIHAMDAFAGAIGVSDSAGKSTPVYSACTPKRDTIDVQYYGRLLRYMAVSGYINALAKGVRERSTEFRWSEASNIVIPVPPEDEQTAIASFLDVETSKIDGLVSEQRRLIELLKEKRQAVISHAVTKGLNPNAPMKPSGIQWLGDVPQHWEIWKFAHFAPIITCGVAATPEYVDEGVPFLSAQNVKKNPVNFDNHKYVSEQTHNELTKHRKIRPGDVLMSRVGAKIGESAVLYDDIDFSIFVSLTHIRTDQKVCVSEFLVNFFETEYFKTFADVTTAFGGGVGNLNVNDLRELRLALPAVDEQKEIVAFVEEESNRMATLLAEAERAIELLQERRTALISAAVTGKIDVREFAYQETL